MKTVYRTTSPADAQIVSDVLRQSGVAAVVFDENLGPYGHVLGNVRVAVAPEREPDARNVVARWEANRPAAGDETQPSPVRFSRDVIVLLIGVVAVLAVVWYFGGR
jgi:hypothetical protein